MYIDKDKQNTNNKVNDSSANKKEFVNNCNRRGVNLENNQQCQILENIIKEVVQEKREGKEKREENREEGGALLGKMEEGKGMYTRKDVQDVIEKYLINYVVQVGEGNKNKRSRIST